MKKLLIVLVTGFLLSACQQEQRYTQQSPEIDSVKSLFELYNSGDFDGQKAFYADTAKLYYNVPESKPSTIDQIISIQKEEVAPFSAYSIDFTDDGVEMVLTDKGETWVNLWGVWKATMAANGQTFEIPVHSTFQFVDGKIVKELGYWDNSSVAMAFMELEAAEKAASDTTASN